MNACAILSQMDKHKDALKMSKKAVQVLNSIKHVVAEIEDKEDESPVQTDPNEKPYLRGYYLMTAVAHYNSGVEFEYMNDLTEAISSINSASTIAKLHLGKTHYLTHKIQESKSKINEKKRRVNGRIHSLKTSNYIPNRHKTHSKHNSRRYECNTETKKFQKFRAVKNVSEERKVDSGHIVGRLPNILGQDQIVINQKPGYRSQNVSKKRGIMNQGQPHTANKINIDENFIWAKNDEHGHPVGSYTGYSTSNATKRVKTSDKSKLGKKLLYRRNKEMNQDSGVYPKGDFQMYAPNPKTKNYARSNIDTSDVFYYKRSSNVSPEQVPPKMENEAQGSQMKTFYSNNDEVSRSKLL